MQQNFIAHMPLLTATSTFGLGRRCRLQFVIVRLLWKPHWPCFHCCCAVSNSAIFFGVSHFSVAIAHCCVCCHRYVVKLVGRGGRGGDASGTSVSSNVAMLAAIHGESLAFEFVHCVLWQGHSVLLPAWARKSRHDPFSTLDIVQGDQTWLCFFVFILCYSVLWFTGACLLLLVLDHIAVLRT